MKDCRIQLSPDYRHGRASIYSFTFYTVNFLQLFRITPAELHQTMLLVSTGLVFASRAGSEVSGWGPTSDISTTRQRSSRRCTAATWGGRSTGNCSKWETCNPLIEKKELQQHASNVRKYSETFLLKTTTPPVSSNKLCLSLCRWLEHIVLYTIQGATWRQSNMSGLPVCVTVREMIHFCSPTYCLTYHMYIRM